MFEAVGAHVREHLAATAAVGEGGGGRDIYVLANPASATVSLAGAGWCKSVIAAVLPHLQDAGAALVI